MIVEWTSLTFQRGVSELTKVKKGGTHYSRFQSSNLLWNMKIGTSFPVYIEAEYIITCIQQRYQITHSLMYPPLQKANW